ncbi:MAG: YncE family protein [Solirubrobacteraceae bacterium]
MTVETGHRNELRKPSRVRNESCTRSRGLAVVLAGAFASAVLVLSACGSRHVSRAPASSPGSPAAEPAVAPVPVAPPAGVSVRVGQLPEGIVADSRTGLVVVGVRDPAALVLLDARSGAVVRRVPIPGAPRHLQLVGDGGPVLVPEEPVNQLLELSLPGARSRSIKVGAHPHDGTADGGSVFVNDEFGESVSVIQGTRVVRQIPGFVQPGGLVAVGAGVAVVDVGGNSVTLIDAHSLRVRRRLGAGAGPTHAVAGRDGRLYVVDTRGGAVFSYSTRPTLELLGRFSLPGAPYGIAIDRSRGRLWVTLTAKNQLVELATGDRSLRVSGRYANGDRSLSVIGRYATGRQPNTVAVDQRDGRVFVANSDAGTVQLIDPRR